MNTNRQFPGAPGILSESDIKLLEESVKSWRKCFRESITKYALPWASVATALQYFIAQRSIKVSTENKVPQGFSVQRTVLWFAGNFAIAMMCCLPSCYIELRKKLSPLEGKFRESQGIVTDVKSSEGSFQSHDDINFQSSLDPKIDGPNSDFSHLDLDLEIDISNNESLQVEDIDKQAESLKIPTTTYDDLRKRNRENYYKQLLTSSSPQRDDLQLNTASELQKQKAKSPFPSTSPRKNKYGDDME